MPASMSYEEMRRLLFDLDANRCGDRVYTYPLTGNVDHAAVWAVSENDLDGRSDVSASSFYFVRAEDGTHAALVYDARRDLQWYVLPKYRGKGLLSRTLRSVILPHIAHAGREEQRITIDPDIGRNKFLASRRLAERVGFRLFKEQAGEPLEFTLDLSTYNGTPQTQPQRPGITDARMKANERRILKARQLLDFAHSELSTKYGPIAAVEEFRDEVERLGRFARLLDKVYYGF